MQHKHDARYSYNQDESEAGIRHCSECGIITRAPWLDKDLA